MHADTASGPQEPVSFRRDTVGATIVEYALILAMVATVGVAGVRHFGSSLANVMQFDIAQATASPDTPGPGAGSDSGDRDRDRDDD